MASPVDLVDALREGWQSLQAWAGFWGPVVKLPVPLALQPLAVLGTILSIAAMTGLALSSLALFITSALLLYLIVTQIFGIEISLAV